MPDQFDAMAAELADLAAPADDVCEAGYECHFHPVYGFVPEADCPVHDSVTTPSMLPHDPKENT